jgi:predicted N-acetyltransferase YhbS
LSCKNSECSEGLSPDSAHSTQARHLRQGIGDALLAQVRQALTPEISLILLLAPAAMDYYPKVGFTAADNAFIIKRER